VQVAWLNNCETHTVTTVWSSLCVLDYHANDIPYCRIERGKSWGIGPLKCSEGFFFGDSYSIVSIFQSANRDLSFFTHRSVLITHFSPSVTSLPSCYNTISLLCIVLDSRNGSTSPTNMQSFPCLCSSTIPVSNPTTTGSSTTFFFPGITISSG
jgi:hypothetical protein